MELIGDASMMSSLHSSGVRRKTSFGASSSSTPSQQGIEVTERRALDEAKPHENREEGIVRGNGIAFIDQEVPVGAAIPRYQPNVTQQHADMVHEASHTILVTGELVPPSQHQVEVEPRSSIIFEVGKEDDDDEDWRCFYIVLSALVVAGVIAAIVVSIVTRSNVPEDAR